MKKFYAVREEIAFNAKAWKCLKWNSVILSIMLLIALLSLGIVLKVNVVVAAVFFMVWLAATNLVALIDSMTNICNEKK